MGIVPGHFKAYSVWLMLGLTFTAYATTHSWATVAGVCMIVVGTFIGDQATHLAQADHSAPPPTTIERLLQRYRWPAVSIGSLIASIGVSIL